MPGSKKPLVDESTSLNNEFSSTTVVSVNDHHQSNEQESFMSRNRKKIAAAIGVTSLAAVVALSYFAGRESADEKDQQPINNANGTTAVPMTLDPSASPMTLVPSNATHSQMNTFFLRLASYAINLAGVTVMNSTVDVARFNLRKMLPFWLFGNPELPSNSLSDAFQVHFVANHIYWPLVAARNVSCPDRPHAIYDGMGCSWSVQSMSALEEYDEKYKRCYEDMHGICMETVSASYQNNCTSKNGCRVDPNESIVISDTSFETEIVDLPLNNGVNFTGILKFDFTLGIDGGEPFNATTNIESLSGGFKRFIVELGNYNNKTINLTNPSGVRVNTENTSGIQRAANFFSSLFFRSGSHGDQSSEKLQAGLNLAQNP